MIMSRVFARKTLVCALAVLGLATALGAAQAQAAPGAARKPVAVSEPVSDTRAGHFDLLQAWQATLAYDPTYQAAINERDAGLENRAIGRAGLLPQVSASLGRSRVRGTLEQPGQFDQTISTDLNYTSKTNEIRATQTVFNWARFAEYRQGNAKADYALAAFDTKAKDTSLRLVNRYFQALLAYENVVLTRNTLDANQKQVKVAERRYQSGEGTITDVREAESWRDMARADLIAAQDALIVAQRELQEMVGARPVQLAGVRTDFSPRPLDPVTLEGWLGLAMQSNAEIRTGLQNVRVADEQVDISFGGHLPTLDITASRTIDSSASISTRNQDSAQTSYGFQVSLPVFSGGLTSAQVSQARFNRDRATQELAATREKVAVEVTRQYQAVVSGAERTAALLVAVKSSQQALAAVEKGYQAGTRSIVDILDAQQQLYRAQLDLTQARLEYVKARLMLRGAVGTLDEQAFAWVTREFFGPVNVTLGSVLGSSGG